MIGLEYPEAKELVWGAVSLIGYDSSKSRISENPDAFTDEILRIVREDGVYDPLCFLESACTDVFDELVPGCWDD